ncbi:MAG: hypothetical protein ABIE42_10250 [Candidatus Eisenbacteria bacterium]
MPCDYKRAPKQTAEERRREVTKALEKLAKKIEDGSVTVKVGPQGAIVFAGWGDERKGVTDLCAFRKLTAQGSWALRQAVAKAEAMAGRQVDQRALAAGVHSHDDGQTWGGH